jgi:hypothetical protein
MIFQMMAGGPTKMLRLLAVVSLVLQVDCHSDEAFACPAEFLFVEVVVSEDGQPASGVTITATLDRTGQPIVPALRWTPPVGHYVIVDDASKKLLRSRADWVTVTFSKALVFVTVPYQFREGACHIEKVSGPDSLELH